MLFLLDHNRSAGVCNGGSLLPSSVSVSNYKFAFKLAALLALLCPRHSSSERVRYFTERVRNVSSD